MDVEAESGLLKTEQSPGEELLDLQKLVEPLPHLNRTNSDASGPARAALMEDRHAGNHPPPSGLIVKLILGMGGGVENNGLAAHQPLRGVRATYQ